MNDGQTFEELVDLFLDKCHLGDAPDIATFAAQYPEHTAELLETLPLLNDLEKIGDAARGLSRAKIVELPELPGSDFQLLRKIGGGGMAVVYVAKDVFLDRPVAVKVLREEYIGDQDYIRRFHKDNAS